VPSSGTAFFLSFILREKSMSDHTHLHWEINKPPAPLQPFLAGFWHFQNTSSQQYQSIIVPDGHVDIIYTLTDDGIRCILRGLDTLPHKTSIPSNANYFSINFKLLAIEYLLTTPVKDSINDGKLLPSNWWNIQPEDLLHFDTFCHKITTKLLPLIPNEIDQRKQQLFDLIYDSKGTITVIELSQKTFWNSRQINRYFNEWFGLSLKSYCNIVRMSTSFKAISEGKLFPELDYTDQNHFIKEIKKYTGVTPKELYKNNEDRFAVIAALRRTQND
jgi:AraC-like DNA-binding protein